MIATVDSVAELAEAVRGAERVLPIGAGTKPALSTPPEDVVSLDVSGLRGIVQYDPSELTVTARAGTPIAEIAGELAANGQYLPFDPPWAGAGATLGGAVAAGASGANAFRHGSVRDFVLAVDVVDGAGRAARSGAAVVKNAAGFDVSKLLVGSAGRLGVISQLTVKVFPAPAATATAAFAFDGLPDAVDAVRRLGGGPLGIEALELEPPGRVIVRIGGAAATLPQRLERLATLVGRSGTPVADADEPELWRACTDLDWAGPDERLVRIGVHPGQVAALHECVERHGARARYGLGASVAWVAWPGPQPLDALAQALTALDVTGMLLRDPAAATSAPILLGAVRGGRFAQRIRRALDPDSRFLEY